MLVLQSIMFTKSIRSGPLDLQWVQLYNKRIPKKRIAETTQVFNILRNKQLIMPCEGLRKKSGSYYRYNRKKTTQVFNLLRNNN